MSTKIVIIGYGMVGKAIANGFEGSEIVIVDPLYTSNTIEMVCQPDVSAVFICVPTPTDGTDFSLLKQTITEVLATGYTGMVVVKSTVLPGHLNDFNVIYNPEFLSRATANEDFLYPHLLIIGGNRGAELLELYHENTKMKAGSTWLTNNDTASLVKYTLNTFFALKVTFMNEIYDVAKRHGIEYEVVTDILSEHPFIGGRHLMVPGPDGQRGFGGPCLPKDTKSFSAAYDIDLLKKVLEVNERRNRQPE